MTRDKVAAQQHKVWESIAASFDASRQRTWPHVESFLHGLEAGARVLDLMAGNGRHTAVASAAGLDVVALDWSRPLAAAAARRAPSCHVVVGDATCLPFSDAVFDACIYVAGLHGIPDARGRLASLHELRRVLRPGGEAQVTVWSREAPRFGDQGAPGESLDVAIPWRSDGHNAARTYHLYTMEDLVEDAEEAGLRVTRRHTEAIIGDQPDNLVVHLSR